MPPGAAIINTLEIKPAKQQAGSPHGQQLDTFPRPLEPTEPADIGARCLGHNSAVAPGECRAREGLAKKDLALARAVGRKEPPKRRCDKHLVLV